MASTISKMREVDPAMVEAARSLRTVAAKLAMARGRTPGLTVAAKLSSMSIGSADSANDGAIVHEFCILRASSQCRIWSSRSLSDKEDAAVEGAVAMRC